jgi:hypothetical protein
VDLGPPCASSPLRHLSVERVRDDEMDVVDRWSAKAQDHLEAIWRTSGVLIGERGLMSSRRSYLHSRAELRVESRTPEGG